MEDKELRAILFAHMDEQSKDMDALSKMTAVAKIVASSIDDITKSLEYGRCVNRKIEAKLKKKERKKVRVA